MPIVLFSRSHVLRGDFFVPCGGGCRLHEKFSKIGIELSLSFCLDIHTSVEGSRGNPLWLPMVRVNKGPFNLSRRYESAIRELDRALAVAPAARRQCR